MFDQSLLKKQKQKKQKQKQQQKTRQNKKMWFTLGAQQQQKTPRTQMDSRGLKTWYLHWKISMNPDCTSGSITWQ